MARDRLLDRQSNKGIRKAAILLIGLGPSLAAQIFKELSDREIELLTREMAEIENVPAQEIEGAAKEFADMVMAKKYLAAGGLEYAKQVLVEALDTAHAMKIVERVRRSSRANDLDGLSQLHRDQFISLLNEEHPQTVAFILSQLESEQAGKIFMYLNEELQKEVIIRLAKMDRIDVSLIEDVESSLTSMLDVRIQHEEVRGIEKTANILNLVGQAVEKRMMDVLSSTDPALAAEVEKRMFTFEMILRLEDKDIQRVLRDVDLKDLAVALKVAKPELKERIYTNMSERARTMLEEEIEYLGKVRLRDVEETQLKIAMHIKRLVESGEVAMPTVGEKEVYV